MVDKMAVVASNENKTNLSISNAIGDIHAMFHSSNRSTF